MTANLKPYPEYKDSGVPWLGKIPKHWRAVKIKHLFRERVQKGFPDEVLLAATQNKGVVPKSHYENRTVVAQKDLHLLKLVERSDFVISLRSFQGGIEYAHFRGIISPAYTIMIPNSPEFSGYWRHLFKASPFIHLLTTCVTGIREGQNIDYEILRRSHLPETSPNEQIIISQYLDSVTRKINRFIRAKRRMIALLREQKQAIINHSVTRGLDPNVPLKPSGIPWLGEIPEHWGVMRVKRIAKILRGKFSHRPRNDPAFYDGDYPFIQTGDVAQAKKFITSYKQTLNENGFAVSKEFPRGTLVMTIAANIGDVAILDFDACFPDSIVGFVPSKRVDLDFLFYAFTSMRSELLREAPVNTQGNLNIERVGSMDIVVPPKREQRNIVGEIQSRTRTLDAAITRAEREIALMNEYRTRLIADVVTGKIDVRNVEIGEALERDSLDEGVFEEIEHELFDISNDEVDINADG